MSKLKGILQGWSLSVRGGRKIRHPDLRYGGRSQLETDDKDLGKSGSVPGIHGASPLHFPIKLLFKHLFYRQDTCITLIY